MADKQIVITSNTRKILQYIIDHPDQNQTEVGKRVDISYSQTNTIVKSLKTRNLILMNKKGRNQHLIATEKGKEIMEKIIQINNILQKEKGKRIINKKGISTPLLIFLAIAGVIIALIISGMIYTLFWM